MDGWFATGDIGILDARGYLKIVDRKKELIIRGGADVYPREIEEVLYQHPKVLEAAAVGIPDARLGERVCACIVPRPGESLSFDELSAFLKDKIATYKLPEFVQLLDTLPRTPDRQGTEGTAARNRAGKDEAGMNAQNALRAIDIHSHWSTRRGYPLQTEAELAQQKRTWRSKPEYRSEAEMAEDFRRAGMRVILDFGYTKYLTLDQVREVHDYGFAVQEAHSDVIIGNRVHFQPELGAPALAEFRRCLDRAAGFVGLAVSGSGGLPASDPAWEPFLSALHRGQSAGARFCRHDRARRGAARRRRHHPRFLSSSPFGCGRRPLCRFDDYCSAADLAVAERDDRGAAAQT